MMLALMQFSEWWRRSGGLRAGASRLFAPIGLVGCEGSLRAPAQISVLGVFVRLPSDDMSALAL